VRAAGVEIVQRRPMIDVCDAPGTDGGRRAGVVEVDLPVA
jgi:hypothetical protein